MLLLPRIRTRVLSHSIAVVTKTTRNAMLGLVVLGAALLFAARGGRGVEGSKAAFVWSKFPKFVVAAQVHGVDIGVPGDLDITPALDLYNSQRLAVTLETIDTMISLDGPAGHWEVQPDSERKWIVDELTPNTIAARAA